MTAPIVQPFGISFHGSNAFCFVCTYLFVFLLYFYLSTTPSCLFRSSCVQSKKKEIPISKSLFGWSTFASVSRDFLERRNERITFFVSFILRSERNKLELEVNKVETVKWVEWWGRLFYFVFVFIRNWLRNALWSYPQCLKKLI